VVEQRKLSAGLISPDACPKWQRIHEGMAWGAAGKQKNDCDRTRIKDHDNSHGPGNVPNRWSTIASQRSGASSERHCAKNFQETT
jgi:hypothetical protein